MSPSTTNSNLEVYTERSDFSQVVEVNQKRVNCIKVVTLHKHEQPEPVCQSCIALKKDLHNCRTKGIVQRDDFNKARKANQRFQNKIQALKSQVAELLDGV